MYDRNRDLNNWIDRCWWGREEAESVRRRDCCCFRDINYHCLCFRP